MHMELENALNRYRDFTIKLCIAVEKEEYENLDNLFEKRQQFIDIMNSLKYESYEFKDLCEKISLLKHEEKLNKLINHKQLELKIRINNLSQGKNAVKNYNKKNYVDSIFLSKKI